MESMYAYFNIEKLIKKLSTYVLSRQSVCPANAQSNRVKLPTFLGASCFICFV